MLDITQYWTCVSKVSHHVSIVAVKVVSWVSKHQCVARFPTIECTLHYWYTALTYCNSLYFRAKEFRDKYFCMIYLNDCSIRVVWSCVRNFCTNLAYETYFTMSKLRYPTIGSVLHVVVNNSMASDLCSYVITISQVHSGTNNIIVLVWT